MIAYEGQESYIFVSYAHRDSATVLPILEELYRRGFRLWYDGGIRTGSEWPISIESRLKGCTVFLTFLTDRAVDSRNCRKEINYALSLGKNIIAVHLEDTELRHGMALQLSDTQHLHRSRHKTDASFLDALSSTEMLRACAGDPDKTAGQSAPVDLPKEPQALDALLRQLSDPAESHEAVVEALYESGLICYERRDHERAVHYLEPAARRGHAEAQFYLARCYNDLDQVGGAEQIALWLGKAADQGHAAAQCELATCYAIGLGVEEDAKTAFSWYKRAAEGGDVEAQYRLAKCYSQGTGTKKNPKLAAEWYTEAATDEHQRAQLELAQCYRSGIGVKKNLKKAAAWYSRAEEQGGELAEEARIMLKILHTAAK